MSWRDRSYADEGEYGSYGGGGRPMYRGSGMETLSATSILIIVNIVIYFIHHKTSLYPVIEQYGLMQTKFADGSLALWQVWRLWTATYLHANFHHIFFNMLGLYFFGPALEQVWGRRQFFLVYTLGGIAGNVLLALAGLVNFIDPTLPGLGASGSVLSLLGAAAVLFPDAQVYLYFLFPIRIRTFVIVYGLWFVYNVLSQGSNYGGDLCHIGGMAIGMWWAYSGGVSLSGRHRTSVNPASMLASLFGGGRSAGSGGGTWDKRMKQRREDIQTVDRLLAKIHEQGIQSLSNRERRELEAATRRRQAEDAQFDRLGRD